MICLLIAFAILPLISIDITTQSRGFIRSEYESLALQLIVNGEIDRISIEENKTVKIGDTLIVLRTDKIDEQISASTNKIFENNRFIDDLNHLISARYTDLKTNVYLSEYHQYSSKINEQETQLTQFKKEYTTSRKLFEENVVPKMEYLKAQNDFEVVQNKLTSTTEQYKNKWHFELNKLRLENIDILNTINQLNEERKQYLIIAPISGTINQFSGLQKGSFVRMGQTIAQISPNEDIIVECYISTSDIGFIKEGQEIVFQLDAYHYNQWGLAHGKVKEIPKDISILNNTPIFKVRCTIDERFLQLKNGAKGHIKKGMTLTGRFFLIERNLWQLLFDKVDNWMNPQILDEA